MTGRVSPGRMPEAEALPGSTSEDIRRDRLAVNESCAFFGLEESLSLERFQRYLGACEGDRKLALSLYAHNSAVSAALYLPLQILEISMRNSFHRAFANRYGDWWFDEPRVITDVFQRRKISEAQIDLVKDGKPLTPSRIVASLTFGFWTSCLSARYETVLWRRARLSANFTLNGDAPPKRNQLNRMLTPIRILRNRIAHYEPILYWNLPKHYRNMVSLVSRLSPAASEWLIHHCTFESTYDIELAGQLGPLTATDKHQNSN